LCSKAAFAVGWPAASDTPASLSLPDHDVMVAHSQGAWRLVSRSPPTLSSWVAVVRLISHLTLPEWCHRWSRVHRTTAGKMSCGPGAWPGPNTFRRGGAASGL